MKKCILLLLSLQCSLCHTSLAQNPGDLDNSFANDGNVTKHLAPWLGVAVQPDGKVLAVGNMIARYNTDGTLDQTFGGTGIDTIKVGDTLYTCSAIGIQPDGKILIAGGPMYFNDLNDFLLIRYNADGTLDSSFDGDAVLRTDLNSGSEDYGYALAIQSDGKIIVAGSSNTKLALSRYHSDGALDSTFDYDGKLVINDIGVTDWLNATYVKLQTDGKILVGSSSTLIRLNPDGSVNNSFGTNGLVAFTTAGIRDLAIQPDGKIAVAGGNFKVVRLDSNGNLDNNFGNGGIAAINLPSIANNTSYSATSIALQPDGRILAGGYVAAGQLWNHKEFILVRYNPDGSIDSTFSLDGQAETLFSPNGESHASAMTPDFKIVLAGYFDEVGYGLLARYHLGWLLDVNTVAGPNESFVIAPNPTQDWINIEASKVENGLWHLEVRDITGRSLLREDVVASNGAIQKKVSLKDLPTGLYVLQLDNGKTKTVSKVVKYE